MNANMHTLWTPACSVFRANQPQVVTLSTLLVT